MSQREFGPALGASQRTATRWDARQAIPAEWELRKLAELLVPVDTALAAEAAAHIGETLESLGLVAPRPPPKAAISAVPRRGPSDEMKTVAATYGPIDLLLPHLGGVGGDGDLGLRTMNSEEAISLVRLLDPKMVVPIHHTTFAHYREPIEALMQRADEAGLSSRFRFPTEGKIVSLP
ncbi:MAG: hypothetical protein M3O46_05705 [Myxococcota bacterium]|nr:hypothetical protein [Myxococcota bacterium]